MAEAVTKPTTTQIAEVVKRLAAEQPDRTEECQYFYSSGAPCCIVGHALAELGVTYREVREKEANSGAAVGDLPAYNVIVDDNHYLLRRIEEVQARQDDGQPWGEAIKALSE